MDAPEETPVAGGEAPDGCPLQLFRRAVQRGQLDEMIAKFGFHGRNHSRTFPTIAIGEFRLARKYQSSDCSDAMKADELRSRIRSRLEATGKKAVPVAVQIGKGRDYLTDFLKEGSKKQSLGWDVLSALARELECSIEYLTDDAVTNPEPPTAGMVRVIGKVGANPEGTVLLALGDPGSELVSRPPGGTDKAVALEVTGHSMRSIADDGALIYFEDQRRPPTEDMLGEAVVLETDTDEVLVKRLLRGSKPGLYDLESVEGATRRDVKVRWAAHITAIIPRYAAKNLIRRA